ncbi:inner membrane transport permease yadH domain protein, partial [Vibrio parahaemolyticus V-223/04]
KPWYHQRLQ